jgi:hypothetical protein
MLGRECMKSATTCNLLLNHSLVTSCNDSHRITPSIPYHGIRMHADEFLSSSTSINLGRKSLMNNTYNTHLQATSLQNSTIEDKIRGNGIFQHHIRILYHFLGSK